MTPNQPQRSQGAQQLQFIDLTDFSPGIFDDFFLGVQAAPDGAAQLTGTFGCCAGSAGGLIPGPRRVKSYQIPNPAAIFDQPMQAGYYLANDVAIHVLSMRVMSPVRQGTTANFPPFTMYDDNADQHFIMYSWFYDSGNTGAAFKQRCRWRTQKFYTSPTAPTDVSLKNITSTNTVAGKNGKMTHGGGSMDFSRSNTPSVLDPGYAIAAGCFSNSVGDAAASASFFSAYPSNLFPGTDTTASVGGVPANTFPARVVAHQDRLFYLALAVAQAYGGSGGLSNVEVINATQPNNYSITSSTTGSVYVGENPSGVVGMLSMNASQLFCLKARGGGFVISGSFENPTITRLPGIASGFPPVVPAQTPDGGVLYCNDRGVWQWQGGNVSQRVSPQLSGLFWMDPSTAYYEGNRGRLTYSDPFVFFPSNYLYDINSKGWWRLNDVSTNVLHSFYDVTASGKVVATPAQLDPANWTVYEWFDTQQGTSSYSWTSQPLQKSRGRVLNFREIDLTWSGAGTVTITLTGLDGVSSTPITFTSTQNTRGQTINDTVRCQSHDVVCKIVATSADANVAAPRIHRLRLGYQDEMTARQ